MADLSIRDARIVSSVTVDASATTFLAGDLLAHNGTAWVKADADTPSLYARWICMQSVQAGGSSSYTMPVCKEAIVVDTDAPYTADSLVYLSATAGAHTHTRPTSEGQLRQVVGVAISTSEVHLSIRTPREQMVPLILTGASSAYALLDSGNYGGPTLDAQNETATLVAVVPENAVSLVMGKLYLAAEASVGTPTMDVTVSSALDGAQWDAVTADATGANVAREGAAPDEMQVTDITTWMDATDIIRPGAILGMKCLQDDAGTDISFIFGGALYFKVV